VTVTSRPVNLEGLRTAIEGSDATTLAGFYDDNAEIHIVDKNHPPSKPQILKGKGEISSYYEDVCGRAMAHDVSQGLMSEDRLAFTEACAYPDGTRVLCMAMLELKGGKIVRQTNVQAWDE
jgi:hypothetical protein